MLFVLIVMTRVVITIVSLSYWILVLNSPVGYFLPQPAESTALPTSPSLTWIRALLVSPGALPQTVWPTTGFCTPVQRRENMSCTQHLVAPKPALWSLAFAPTLSTPSRSFLCRDVHTYQHWWESKPQEAPQVSIRQWPLPHPDYVYNWCYGIYFILFRDD